MIVLRYTQPEWEAEMRFALWADPSEIEAGYHGPDLQSALARFGYVRQHMLDHLATAMYEDGYSSKQVLDAVSVALGFKR